MLNLSVLPMIYYNPIHRERLQILETAVATQGRYTLLSVEIEPNGGVPLHWHKDFSESFEVLEGTLMLEVGAKTLALVEGEHFVVIEGTPHRFFNTSDRTVRFQVCLSPGQAGFERFLRILFRLAAAGKTYRQVPYHLGYAIILSKWSKTVPSSLCLRIAMHLTSGIYPVLVACGLEQRFIQQYEEAEGAACISD